MFLIILYYPVKTSLFFEEILYDITMFEEQKYKNKI